MTPTTQCLLSPDSPAIYFMAGLCCTTIIGAIIAAVIIWRAYLRLSNMIDSGGLDMIYPDRADHMRRTRNDKNS